MTDNNFDTYYASSNNPCYIGFDFGANYQGEIESVKYFLKLGTDSEDFLGTVIETSDDGTAWTTVMV